MLHMVEVSLSVHHLPAGVPHSCPQVAPDPLAHYGPTDRLFP